MPIRFISVAHGTGRSKPSAARRSRTIPAARERIVKCNPYPPHDRGGHRTAQVIDAAPADVQRPRMPGERQIVRGLSRGSGARGGRKSTGT
jgi:hypothetical protein